MKLYNIIFCLILGVGGLFAQENIDFAGTYEGRLYDAITNTTIIENCRVNASKDELVISYQEDGAWVVKETYQLTFKDQGKTMMEDDYYDYTVSPKVKKLKFISIIPMSEWSKSKVNFDLEIDVFYKKNKMLVYELHEITSEN